MAQSEGAFFKTWDEKIRPLIDVIDELRFTGIHQDLALPSIAVIGDQSSGKSSVLEALSGVALPRGSGMVTRCPLELRLKKIKAGEKWRARISYNDKIIDFEDPSVVEHLVVEAQNDLAGEGCGMSHTLISLEILSPDVCDLTLIDLPGIIRVPLPDQPRDIASQVNDLILRFIEKTETINLVVVPCNVDIATTEALQMAKRVDPEGKRTLAILTKPDLVDRGTERNVLAIALNQVIPLSKGYIMVKCRGQQQIIDRISLADAVKTERDFFRNSMFFGRLLDEGRATTQCLAAELTRELANHIKDSLPRLFEQVKIQLGENKKMLGQFSKGPPRDPQEKKEFFIQIISQFTNQIQRLVSGEAINGQNLYKTLRCQFDNFKDLLDASKESFGKEVKEVVVEYDEKHRGRELPAFSEYRVFRSTVQELVTRLRAPALTTLYDVKEIVQAQLLGISATCFSNYPFLRRFALRKIEEIQTKQEAIAEQRIYEQFKMEALVYTQDGIIQEKIKEKINEKIKEIKALENNWAEVDCRKNYPMILEAYYTDSIIKEKIKEIEDLEKNWTEMDCRKNYPMILEAYYTTVIQRLADQVPMLVQHFLLQECERLLCGEMLGLMEPQKLDEWLDENTESSHQRNELLNRQERLVFAHEKLSYFC
ncbi:interferon-induced GTP-binding protein Mx2-like [Engraulis encrasicolus]|uniref:interferon-induced GTP-binding protein Mx2-like n=1 Tax=Engraulis encrasicolus TaxID=184585 RepID=UPI002FD65728